MPELRLKNLCKNYADVEAVKDLTLEAADGEFLVLVGPSGCGKTTTLRMIAGLEEITSGDIFLDDKRINDVPAKDRDMAMVFQDYALYPHMSVFDNIAFGLKMRKVPKAEIKERVRECAEMLGIIDLLHRKPHALSGGQRQRVALGRAIVRRPKVFLFDEPLSNLDAALRVQMRGDLKQLHKQLGTTFIYVTHDQIEAMTMATNIVVMNKGVMQQCDTPDHLYNKPVNRFVGGFIGNPKMNMIQCLPTMEDGALVCYIGKGRLFVPRELGEKLLQLRIVGKPALLGIRPEHMRICDAGAEDCLTTQIKYIENIRSDIYMHMTSENLEEMIVVRTDCTDAHAEGEFAGVKMDWDHVKIFDEATGEAVFCG